MPPTYCGGKRPLRMLFVSKTFNNYAQVKYEVRSPKFIWATLYSGTHWLRPRPPPRIWAHIRGRYWSATTDISLKLCNQNGALSNQLKGF
jgi:hypothetical protein